MGWELRLPHLAKNERDVGHPLIRLGFGNFGRLGSGNFGRLGSGNFGRMRPGSFVRLGSVACLCFWVVTRAEHESGKPNTRFA
jgi:hypothetical protein